MSLHSLLISVAVVPDHPTLLRSRQDSKEVRQTYWSPPEIAIHRTSTKAAILHN
jgi:hypothetical protein